MNGSPALLLFPGLGTDGRIYQRQRELAVPFRVVEWIEPESDRESLAHYAARMADAIGPTPGAFVGGISLGSMVALEAAALLDARGVFLIGGCRSYREISPLFRAVLGLGAGLPLAGIPPALRLAPLALKLFEGLDKPEAGLMTAMLREHSARQIRWSCRAILGWECCALPPCVPVWSIHGGADEIIPPRRPGIDQILPGARHLINLTRADAVNAFVSTTIRRWRCADPVALSR